MLSLADILFATALIIEHLTVRSDAAIKEIDVDLSQDARDIKILIFGKESYEALRVALTQKGLPK